MNAAVLQAHGFVAIRMFYPDYNLIWVGVIHTQSKRNPHAIEIADFVCINVAEEQQFFEIHFLAKWATARMLIPCVRVQRANQFDSIKIIFAICALSQIECASDQADSDK